VKEGLTKMNNIEISFDRKIFDKLLLFFENNSLRLLMITLAAVSIYYFIHYLQNGLGLSYNDARSHLDIGRRVVEGLKPGIAQLGSVWLPMPHILMIPFVWNDFLWHTGLAGAISSMISFVASGVLIFLFLRSIGVGLLGRFVGVVMFVLNINILYLQSTAMTELLLIATTLASVYYLLLWSQKRNLVDLIKTAFWVMLSTLTRYDGWFMFAFIAGILMIQTIYKDKQSLLFHNKISIAESLKDLLNRYKHAEGMFILFCTLGGFGIFLWLLWNLLIFGDPLFFAFGQYSAHAQQLQLEGAGNLATKHNLILSLKTYMYAMFFNSNTFITILGIIGSIIFWLDKRFSFNVKLAVMALWGPLLFNVTALYLGHSVLFIQGIQGNSWFNARYGIMLMPTIAIFIAYMFDRLKDLRLLIFGLCLFVSYFTFVSGDSVTVDDARVGSSQKNVSEVSGWLKDNAKDKAGFVLISAASHDAIIFSSSLPMSKFIHEGTGKYWEDAAESPDRWARWIIMRTYDDSDSTWREIKDSDGYAKYRLVEKYPFADIYELKEEYVKDLNTKPIYNNQK
jgi:hypothetical protein